MPGKPDKVSQAIWKKLQVPNRVQTHRSNIHGNSCFALGTAWNQRANSENGGGLAGKYSSASFVKYPNLRPPQPFVYHVSPAACRYSSRQPEKPRTQRPETTSHPPSFGHTHTHRERERQRVTNPDRQRGQLNTFTKAAADDG